VIAVPTSRGVLVATLKGHRARRHGQAVDRARGRRRLLVRASNRGERLACVTEKGVAIYDAR